ncbi:hypothetical protein NQ317_012760 [Molorchus minor]|uniref:non-specific serine/threonine protein kinase n=1 Tax=Molorchus minor TaxID=1323400 RepID=A0ABQ9K444_9CUCU|nr:hypothetical protein NQ317_012760 [Molorchus minor]
MYIYHLPYEERRQLCYILDQNNLWEDLSGYHMKYDLITIETLRKEICRGKSPTNELFTIWGHQNHTVLELFILLNRMNLYQAMTVIKHLVDERYHCLIKDGEENLNRLMENFGINRKPCNRDSKTRPENFNENTEKILNVPQLVLQPIVSKENNESTVDPKLLQPRSPLPPPRVGISRNFTASDISCVAESAGAIPHITYEELQRSTNSWDSHVVLGRGGFGTVYKGTWKCTKVAIKRLEQKADKPEQNSVQIKQSITELHCLNAYRHDNVLPLYGYSIDGPHPCLIYQYMAGGSLEKRLSTREPSELLNWPARLNIAIGTARGLQFLHTSMINGTPLVHGDIKSANILLDPNDQPRIGDFGLAREGPPENSRPKWILIVLGLSYLKSLRPWGAYSEKRQEKFLRDHVVNYEGDVLSLKDKLMVGYDECFKGLIEIGKMCVNKRAKDRPEMVNVLILLEGVPPK